MGLRPLAEGEVPLHQLTPLTDQPEVVQGKDDRKSSFFGHADEVRRQAGDMMKMDNVRADQIEKLAKLLVDDVIPIRLLK
jgi:hypothetical protein